MIGFLEESEGVRSMSRLTIGWMSALATLLVVTACVYVIKGHPSAEVLAAIGGLLATVVVKGAVALINRNSSDAA